MEKVADVATDIALETPVYNLDVQMQLGGYDVQ